MFLCLAIMKTWHVVARAGFHFWGTFHSPEIQHISLVFANPNAHKEVRDTILAAVSRTVHLFLG